MAESKPLIRWLPEPEDRHVRAARDYLSLVAAATDVELLMSRLAGASSQAYAAKDLLRATGLPLLAAENPHVARNLKAIRAGEPLSPVLAVRGNLRLPAPLTLADGYHRLSACALVDENSEVMCRLAALGEDAS